jgi:hypothetical protein
MPYLEVEGTKDACEQIAPDQIETDSIRFRFDVEMSEEQRSLVFGEVKLVWPSASSLYSDETMIRLKIFSICTSMRAASIDHLLNKRSIKMA